MKRTLIRAWGDLAPKLLAFLGTGAAVTGLIALAGSFGLMLDPTLANAIVVIAATVVGYLVPDKVEVPLEQRADGTLETPSA